MLNKKKPHNQQFIIFNVNQIKSQNLSHECDDYGKVKDLDSLQKELFKSHRFNHSSKSKKQKKKIFWFLLLCYEHQ